MRWEEKTLDQLGSISRGKSKHRPRNDPKLFGGQYPFIQTADVKNANFYITEYTDTYNEQGLAQSKLWEIGTLCITIAANIADTAILAIPACFPDSIMGFIPYKGISDARFVKYCFDMLQQDCKQISQGTAQDNLSWQKLSTIKFPAPPLETQRRIADILSAYDDLIENNRKQIKLLEEAAQRLYKEWFVDLRFPGHEHTRIVDGVPEGWEYIPLGKIFSYEIGGGWGEDAATEKNDCPGFVIRGTDIDEIKQGDLLSIPYRFHAQGNLASRKLQAGDIIFEVSGGSKNTGIAKTLLITKAILDVWQKPVICASFCKMVRFNEPQIAQYIYDCFQYWRTIGVTQEYEKKSASSIINFRWKDFLGQKCVLLPEKRLLQKYCALSSSFYKQAITNAIVISKATQARDRLLPKLMSGEVEV